MAYNAPVTIEASSAKSASGNGATQSFEEPGASVAIIVNVSAVSGTGPTLDLKVQWSHDGSTWADGEPADSFVQITAAKIVAKIFARKGPFYRLVWTLGGTTPNFTFGATRASF